jgi:hypothetical protein
MYRTSLEHILAELERLDLLLRVQVWRARQSRDADDLTAFYIPETEPDELLDKAIGAPRWAGVPLPPELQTAAQDRLDQLSAAIARDTAASLREGVPLRLAGLARLFGLTAFDLDVILICLASELDRSYERLYAYLQDDVTRPYPTVDLILSLLCPGLDAQVAARQRLYAAAPLLRHHLVELAEEPGRMVSGLSQAVRLDQRVARFLLGDDTADDRLLPVVTVLTPTAGQDELVFPELFGRQFGQLLEQVRAGGAAPDGPARSLLYFQGLYGAGKRSAAGVLAQALGHDLLIVAGQRLAGSSAAELATLGGLASREAVLRGALLYWQDFDLLLPGEDGARLAAVVTVLEAHPGLVVVSGSEAWEPEGGLRGTGFLRLAFPSPGYDERVRLWQTALGPEPVPASLGLEPLAVKFRLTGGQIRDAAATARGLARWRDPRESQLTPADLLAACRLHSNRKLTELAAKITPHYAWDDIVLPADQLTQLREICDQVQHRSMVYDAWGFDGKLAMGKGLSVLFAGPPGTGKTMAADVLAGALGLDMYKIDLSTVVSKYIGETEKNLARIFHEATTSNAILFFDEADALFGKRTQVRDAHDRYANVEVSYLLQKMEEYEGMVILATNLRKNMDEAFVRRLHVTVEFPVPGQADRRRIWAQIWPAATPREAGLDLDFLARRVEVPGGSIRNIALASAFRAAADGGVVTMAHVLHATRREYQKMGKVLTAGDLGDGS